MSLLKSKIIVLSEDVFGLQDKNEKFDPDKTIYDLKTKSIRSGTVVLQVKECEDSSSRLILFENDFFWIISRSLKS
tara:strand:- start:300 stop:527 length:228 start_codon:yes stop_codon:yes gene_type:complete